MSLPLTVLDGINRSQIQKKSSVENFLPSKMEYIIDIQGFKRTYNEFVVKELAIVPLEDDVQPTVYLFGPPHDWNLLNPRCKCEKNWLTRNYHGIK